MASSSVTSYRKADSDDHVVIASHSDQALRLWAKGARPVPRQNAALNPCLATAKAQDYTSPALSVRGKD